MQSSYITSAQRAEQLPDLQAEELAFIGRSNCGKSSLLNALVGRVKLARASNTPGRTQMVNFFAVEHGEARLILADLPGYGYAATSRETRRHWQSLVSAYLQRPQIRELLFLVDIRRADPPNAEDLELLASLTARRPAAPVTAVLTKCDKVSAAEAAKIKTKLAHTLEKAGIDVARITSVSTLRKTGIEDLRQALLAPVLGDGRR